LIIRVVLLFFLFSVSAVNAQNQEIQDLVDKISISTIEETLDSLCWAGGHQSRITFTPGSYYGAEYIATYFESLPGISKVVRDTFYMVYSTPPYDTYPMINISAYLEGTAEDPELIVVGGHHDASSNNDPDYSTYWETRKAQGADDNASGVAAVMEIARVLSDPQNGYQNTNTIKFIAYGAEEYHPMHAGYHHIGSLYDAQMINKEDLNLTAVLVLDMITYNTEMDYIEVISDENSLWLADTVLSCAERYVPGLTTNDHPLPDVPYSDHESYQQYGYPAILMMENDKPWNDHLPYYTANPYYHKEADIIETLRMSQLEKVAKLGLASTAVLGQRTSVTAIQQNLTTVEEQSETQISIYPNPFNSETTINFNLQKASEITISVYNILGEKVSALVNDQNYQPGSHSVRFDGTNLTSGTYFCQIISSFSNDIMKIVLIK
jgi:hypothetical protein